MAAIYGHKDGRRAFGLQWGGELLKRRNVGHAVFGQELRFADQHTASIDGARDASTGGGLEILGGLQRKLPFAGRRDNRMCQRVFAALLERSGKAKEVGLGEAVSGEDLGQLR